MCEGRLNGQKIDHRLRKKNHKMTIFRCANRPRITVSWRENRQIRNKWLGSFAALFKAHDYKVHLDFCFNMENRVHVPCDNERLQRYIITKNFTSGTLLTK